MKVYVFAGEFEDRAEACLYSEPQWEPEPDNSVSNAEYLAWENRNPVHRLENNMCTHLDSDFIETVDLSYDYLYNLNVCDCDIKIIKEKIKPGFNYFVLVFEDALGGIELENQPVSTSLLEYCGQYDFEW